MISKIQQQVKQRWKKKRRANGRRVSSLLSQYEPEIWNEDGTEPKVCEKDCVDRVIVVEVSQELLDWYGYDLCSKFGKVTDVICDDVYNELGRHGDDVTYLLDIWPTYQSANADRRLLEAKHLYGNRLWAWGWENDKL